ncbi:hypothetical protein [Reinekea sp. G2M2-21]|uniref:hypothetical protein n=1 Tax=Reinekea sp. G2M2-21 TaxID=2788942 RepID=UPI001E490394|nr:hypothetical protein [Reinekea sp. G2M2-21]
MSLTFGTLKNSVFVAVLFASCHVMAGGWATAAIPTRIDIERGNGFMIYGSFGNAGGCSQSNKVFVKIDHPQYDAIYSTVLAAYMAGKKVQPYIHTCEPVTWYAVPTTTFNILSSSGALNLL